MSVLFQVRGTSIDAYHAAGFAAGGTFFNSGATPPAVQADATSGVIGGSVINLSNASQSTGLCYSMRRNFPVTPAFAILMRVVMKHTADGSNFPSNNQGLFCIGDPLGNTNDGVSLSWKTTGKFALASRINYQINNQVADSAGTVGLTTNAVHEVLLSWDGTSGSNKWKLFVDGVLSQQWTASNGYGDAGVPSQRTLQMIGSLLIGVAPSAALSEFYLNELVIWDTVMDYSSGLDFNRVAFVSATSLDGSVYTDPGIANIRSGTSYTQAGVAEVGTAAIPVAGNVRAGIATDATVGSLVVPSLANTAVGVAGDGGTGTFDGSTRWTSPAANQLQLGVQLKSNSTSLNLTGTAAIPVAGNVRSGVATGTTSGSLIVPAASDVRHNVAVDAGLGLAYIPTPGNTRAGVNVDATVGNVEIPALGDVRSGTSFDTSSTGVLDLPAVSDVKSGVHFDSNAQIGTNLSTDPGVAHVANGTAYDINSVHKVGTLQTITNSITLATLEADIPSGDVISNLTVTVGDAVTFNFRLKQDVGYFNLAGATIETHFLGADGTEVVIGMSDHTIDSDQTNNPGKVAMRMNNTNGLLLKATTSKQDIIMKVLTAAGDTIYFHGRQILTVLANTIPNVN